MSTPQRPGVAACHYVQDRKRSNVATAVELDSTILNLLWSGTWTDPFPPSRRTPARFRAFFVTRDESVDVTGSPAPPGSEAGPDQTWFGYAATKREGARNA